MSDNILVNAIREIVGMAKPQIYGIEGHQYASAELVEVLPHEDVPDALTVHTLKSLADYIRREGVKHADKEHPLFVEVDSYRSVTVRSSLTAGLSTNFLRRTFYRAESDVPRFELGWMDLEKRIIQLRAQCADTDGRNELLEMLSSVCREEGTVSSDNGVTQEVIVREGVALKEMAQVKPYVTLQPYRTFLEVEQPVSEFLLRLDKDCNVGLFEADGGAWKLEAARNIGSCLETELAQEINDGLVMVTI